MKRLRLFVVRAGVCGLAVLGIVGVVSLDRVDREPYVMTGYYAATTARLHAHAETNGAVVGTLEAGFGCARLTPELGAEDDPAKGKFRVMPLAGYGARKGKGATGVHDDVYVKAVALRVGGRVGVMASADALIIPREVAELALERLKEAGLQREQVYFSATHTHCSIGAWGEGVVAEMFAGKFQSGARVWFAESIVRAIREALGDLQPASFGHGSFEAPEMVRNRLRGSSGTIDPEFDFLFFKQDGGSTAVVGSFAAHATVLSSRVMEFSGDYPGAWQRGVERRTGGKAIFMAGGVGSHSPVAGADGFEGVDRMGEELAEMVMKELPRVALTNAVRFEMVGIDVSLPSVHARVSNDIRLRPWLARELLGVRNSTFMQAFRLNDAVWISTPCDYSGELALELKEKLAMSGFDGTVTSFNGDYIGYVIPSRYYSMEGYEPRTMSFFGPSTGDYVSELVLGLGKAVIQ